MTTRAETTRRPKRTRSVDAVLVGRPAHVTQDRGAVGDRLRSAPGRERVAERVHVGVRADPGIAEQVPGAADRVTRLEQREAAIRCITAQVTRGADPRQTGADDQDIEMLSVGTHAYHSSKRTCRARRYDQPPVRYPVESFTDAERQRLRRIARTWTARCSRSTNLPETVKGALFARYSRYPGTLRRLLLDEFADDLHEPVAGAATGQRGCRARVAALRADLPRLRRRLGRAARRRARRLRVGLEPADQDPPAPAAGRLPGAVDALHRLRRADARRPAAPRTATTAIPSSGPSTSGAMDELFSIYSASIPVVSAWAARGVPDRRRRLAGRARARDPGQGARPPARAAAGRVAVAHGHLRVRPDLRAADHAPARASAARGPQLRRAAADRGAGGDSELRRARAATGPRRRVDRVPAERGAGRRSVGRAARSRP